MNTNEFLSKEEALEYKAFVEHLTGIEPLLSEHELTSSTGTPDTTWKVSLREVELSADQQARCESCVRRLSQKRGEHLERISKEYRALSLAELNSRWDDPRGSLDTDEKKVLLAALRAAAGIRADPGILPRTCRQCGMVEDNCTCTRSWF